MTWVLKHKPLPGSPMLCEYLCDEHGPFESTVARDELGDPPATLLCELCQSPSPRGFTAAKIKFWSRPAYAASRGKDSGERNPNMLDTRKLAEGQSYGEWRKEQDATQADRRYSQLIKSGLKTKRIQVG